MLKRLELTDRESWLRERVHGLGASDASAAVGLNPWRSNIDLWKEKTGRLIPEDISDAERIIYGNKLEPILREMFKAEHPEYTVDYDPYGMLFQEERPWLRATLDGELTETETGRKGVLEIKTATCTKRTQWEEWHKQMPQHYYIQCLSQLLATGYGFVRLYAKIAGADGNSSLRCYEIERGEVGEDLEWLTEKLERFWKFVETDEEPTRILPEI